MEYNREHLSSLLKRVKLTNSDLARLLGVSRVTVYNWLRNGTPHRMVAGKLARVTEALEAAEAAGALPIVERHVEERARLLKEAVFKYLRR